MDKGNISPKGYSQIEPCDILEIKVNVIILHHVKRTTSSSSLSHLFNQGVNSIRLIRSDNQVYDNLKNKIYDSQLVSQDNLDLPNKQIFKVIFQIITHKDKEGLSLKRTIKELSCMGVDAEFCFIKDDKQPSSTPKIRKRKIKDR